MTTLASPHGQPTPRPAAQAGETREGAAPRIVIVAATSRAVVLGGCLLMATLIGLPLIASRSLLQDLVFIFYMLSLAQFWNLLAGYTGLVSVGQQAFVGLGGYLLFAFAILLDVHPIAAILIAGPIGALVAIPTALVVFRLQG